METQKQDTKQSMNIEECIHVMQKYYNAPDEHIQLMFKNAEVLLDVILFESGVGNNNFNEVPRIMQEVYSTYFMELIGEYEKTFKFAATLGKRPSRKSVTPLINSRETHFQDFVKSHSDYYNSERWLEDTLLSIEYQWSPYNHGMRRNKILRKIHSILSSDS